MQSFPVVQKCSVPSLLYFTRTTPTNDSLRVRSMFDEHVDTIMKNLLSVEKLDSTQQVMTHLPKSLGGLGVMRFMLVGEVCYRSSFEGVAQSSLLALKNKELFDSLPPNLQNFMKRNKDKNSSFWMTNPVSKTDRDASFFTTCLKHRMNLQVVTGKKCVCGVDKEVEQHVLGCSKLVGANVSWRHSVLCNVIASFCRDNFIPVSASPFMVRTESSHARADLLIAFGTDDFYVDLTVINSFCKSHSHKDSEALYKEKEKSKETRYLKHVEARGGSFVTFSVEVNGVLSRSAKLLVDKIEKYVDKVGELK